MSCQGAPVKGRDTCDIAENAHNLCWMLHGHRSSSAEDRGRTGPLSSPHNKYFPPCPLQQFFPWSMFNATNSKSVT